MENNLETAIKKAIEGGYTEFPPTNGESIYNWAELVLVDPKFWQSLGQALGWNGLSMEFMNANDVGKIIEPNEWKSHWHDFIDYLIAGKSPDGFFSDLLSASSEEKK